MVQRDRTEALVLTAGVLQALWGFSRLYGCQNVYRMLLTHFITKPCQELRARCTARIGHLCEFYGCWNFYDDMLVPERI